MTGRSVFTSWSGSDSLVSVSGTGLSSAVIVSIIVAALIVMLIIVDLSCYCMNKSGLLMLVCEKTRSSRGKEDDIKLGSLYSWRFPLPYCSSKDGAGAGVDPKGPIDEKEPLRDENRAAVMQPAMKRDTAVEYDIKRSLSRTSFVGKDSAV
uniref:Uncharacterized protein n=1 Tax=Timema genevievae TaxID=629358 RepID=A0A7R9PQQ9_TIMGE|nr:unnamed protein product [Timema genevievae]